jgi:hypothetical protein
VHEDMIAVAVLRPDTVVRDERVIPNTSEAMPSATMRLHNAAVQRADTITQPDCDAITARLNSRQRKRLGYRTPDESHAASR